jgi:hypothetical protein
MNKISTTKIERRRDVFHHLVVRRMKVMAREVLLNARVKEFKKPIRVPVTVTIKVRNCH